jgi:type I pantothenate kinase
MNRKGFPESFDIDRLRQFLNDVKSGRETVDAPVYSHIAYDIIDDQKITVTQPDILIVEGLNVLQPAIVMPKSSEIPFVSDYFDFSIFIDADKAIVQDWYVDRFLFLKDTAFREPGAYFQRYADLTRDEAIAMATDIWTRINLKNLNENIIPTRGRADLILHKSADHLIDQVLLRKV